jgi:hypothetical protein
MLHSRVPPEADTTTKGKKPSLDDLANRRPPKNVARITNPRVHILENSPKPPAALSPEELQKLKTEFAAVERYRSLALTYHQRNTIR